jgi:uncharacterized oligopeptide transporter (OPT) family protein
LERAASGSKESTLRTDQDIPLPICGAILLDCILPFYIVISLFMDDWLYTILLSFFVVVFGFFASAIAAYMAGWFWGCLVSVRASTLPFVSP